MSARARARRSWLVGLLVALLATVGAFGLNAVASAGTGSGGAVGVTSWTFKDTFENPPNGWRFEGAGDRVNYWGVANEAEGERLGATSVAFVGLAGDGWNALRRRVVVPPGFTRCWFGVSGWHYWNSIGDRLPVRLEVINPNTGQYLQLTRRELVSGYGWQKLTTNGTFTPIPRELVVGVAIESNPNGVINDQRSGLFVGDATLTCGR